MKKHLTILCFLICFSSLFSQNTGSKNDPVIRYTQAQVLDSAEGMLIYSKMMKVLETDYKMRQEEGSGLQGWSEEYYDNGKLLHVSYYKEGKLVLFKNFFENGQCQNNIAYTDSDNCNIDVYFENGSLKNQLHFIKGQPKKLTEFFVNGLPKNNIEFDPENKVLNLKKSWYLNAQVQSELILDDASKKKYTENVYYPHGQLKEQGELIYSPQSKEYIKNGTWYVYESSGKKKSSEKFKISLSSK